MIENIELANTLYWGCYFLGFVAIFIFNPIYGKHYNLQPKKSLIFTIVSYLLIYLWAYILAWVVNGFKWGHHNAIRVYIWFPLVLFLLGKKFRIDFRTACEYMAPSTCIVYGIARLGCIFTGCCYGIPASWGMYSYSALEKCFPVQLCEGLTSLLIAVIVILLAKKKKYEPTGKLYPFMLVIYGATRFVWELFSAKPRVLFGITELGIWAFLTTLVGVVWLIIFKKRHVRS